MRWQIWPKLQTDWISQADKAKKEIMDIDNNEQQCNWRSLAYGKHWVQNQAPRKLPDEESWNNKGMNHPLPPSVPLWNKNSLSEYNL